MKNVGLTAMLLVFALTFSAQRSEVEKSIKAFSAAADDQNTIAVGALLDPSFRAVINSESMMIIDHDSYLSMLEQKKIGGDKRAVKIHNVTIVDDLNAVARATITGEKAIFRSLFSLSRVGNEWKIVQDLVVMELL